MRLSHATKLDRLHKASKFGNKKAKFLLKGRYRPDLGFTPYIPFKLTTKKKVVKSITRGE